MAMLKNGDGNMHAELTHQTESLSMNTGCRIFPCQAATRAHEGETVSNRTSESYVESTPCFAHTAHHARKVLIAGSIPLLIKSSQAYGAANRAGGDLSEVDTR